jgi:hypothetical protein
MLWRQARFALETAPHVREPAARARLRGQAAALAALPRFLSERRQVQRRRRVTDAAIDSLLLAAGG